MPYTALPINGVTKVANEEIFMYQKETKDNLVGKICNELLWSNDSFQKIARKYGLTPEEISKIDKGEIEKNESLIYPLRKSNLPNYERNKQIQFSLLYENDKSIEDISKEFNVSVKYILSVNSGAFPIPKKEYPLRKRNEFIDVEGIIKSEKTLKEISRKFKVSYSFVKSLKEGNEIERRTLTPKERNELERELRETKKSMREIAKENNVSFSFLCNFNSGKIKKYKRDTKYPLRDTRHYKETCID